MQKPKNGIKTALFDRHMQKGSPVAHLSYYRAYMLCIISAICIICSMAGRSIASTCVLLQRLRIFARVPCTSVNMAHQSYIHISYRPHPYHTRLPDMIYCLGYQRMCAHHLDDSSGTELRISGQKG